MTSLSWHEFQPFLDRDGWCCVHCGERGSVVPGHRQGRGMGGSKARHRPSNIVVMCHWLNSEIESNAAVAADARDRGWKLASWQNPATTPVYDYSTRAWWLLDDEYGRVRVDLLSGP